MKRTFSLFLTFLLFLLLYCTDVFAEDMVKTSGQDLSGGVVTGFGYERAFRSLESQTLSCRKDDLTDLYNTITDVNEVLYSTVQLSNNMETVAMCSATWNTVDLPLATPGAYKLIATLTPPNGCTFGPGVRTQIVIPVQISDGNVSAKIVSMADWTPYSLAIAAPQHGTLEDITSNGLFQDFTTYIIRCKDEYGSVYFADIAWDFSPLNLEQPGIYTLTGTPIPPEGTVFAENLILPKPTATISIQAPNQPDINCFYLLYPDMCFPWIAPAGGLDSVTIWLSEEGMPWQELTSINQASAQQDSIRLDLDLFTNGNQYRLQVDHKYGQTGIFSFVWDDTIEIGGYWGGDRDGGDSSMAPPSAVQPPSNPDKDNGSMENGDTSIDSTPSPLPTPDSTISSMTKPNTIIGARENTIEEVTDTTTTISGGRLRMMQTEGGIPFSKQGVNLLLSKEAIDSLPLEDNSIFTIEIKREDEQHFSFSVWVDRIQITDLVGTKVTLPYTPDSKDSILGVRHNVLHTENLGSYEQESGLASFIVNAGGGYTLRETSPQAATSTSKPKHFQQPETQQQTKTLIITIAAISISFLLVAGGILFVKRRGRR